ncbi:putative nuclease HARBI1 [Cololabis saira]|uniref:putative nuclease HARBI1 n=1 Tax=Cololabis saira TaxID=129043 RepID=UPI002AD51439|nr:putative nuclease HARBI1 [Cololabis saira]
MAYLCQLLDPYVASATRRSRALTVPQTICIALRYFATGTYLYAVSPEKVKLEVEKLEYEKMMTCDHNCMVTSIDAKWPGSVHDSRIFRESTLCHRLEQGLFSGVLVGDRGYACQPFLMTPYPDPDAGPQTRFNVALSRTRVRIEMTFGILKARFTCLRGLRVAPDRASRIVAACVVLHNVATIRRERAPPVDQQPPDVVDPITLDYPTGRAVREAITDQFLA